MSEVLSHKKLEIEGAKAYQRGDYHAAAVAFRMAAVSLNAAGEIQKAAEMANNCCVAFLQCGKAKEALQAVEGTPAIFSTSGDVRNQGLALGNLAAAMEALGRMEEAADYYQQSADALEQAGDDASRLKVMQALSAMQLKSGQQLQALASMQNGLEGIKKPTIQQAFLKKLLRLPFQFLK